MAPKSYDLDLIRQAASPRWPEILSSLARVDADTLGGRACPCPKCGGSDRFRVFTDGTGGAICNQCFRQKNGDGFSVLQWLTGQNFAETLASVAAYLGIEGEDKPIANGNGNGGSSRSSGSRKNGAAPHKNGHVNGNGHAKADRADPAAHLEFISWNEMTAALWCLRKPGIKPAAIQAVGGQLARYRKEYTVVAIPVYGQDFAQVVGWSIYNATGGTLPKWSQGPDKKLVQEWVKVKLTQGSQQGIMADVGRLHGDHAEATTTTIKVEGPSDLLAALSLDDLPQNAAPWTNANGAKERPADWMTAPSRGKVALLVHDCDKPGQDGAIGWTDDRGGRRPGWLDSLAAVARDARNIVLPYSIEESHGKDLRDWIADGGTFAGLVGLAEEAEPLAAEQAVESLSELSAIEADDDPHRLSRVNLEHYAAETGGATIRYWREEWYTWTKSRGCYRKIGERELRAKMGLAIKKEFDRINLERQKLGDDDEPPVAKKVTCGLLTNVMLATASTQIVPAHAEAGSLIRVNERPAKKNWIAMRNGILDVDALLAGEDDVLRPHTPDWFSTNCLPYEFDVNAECPKFEAYLQKNQQGDVDRIATLQEWAGYLLLPDTGHQKFMILEGEGSNGKSVFMAVMQALIGGDNTSNLSLEMLTDKFERSETLGKLLNICPDAGEGEIEKKDEGLIKSLISGEPMSFSRKFLSSISCYPTARIMISCNSRPRFSDRSDGIWRRMILIPWQIQIQSHEKIQNMDKPWFWEQSGEMPGIFLWALQGLHRLRQQNRFTESQIEKEAKQDYQEDSNPARAFLREYLEKSDDSSVRSEFLYHTYAAWCEANGNRPLSDKNFGKEIRRVFPGSEKKRGGGRSTRFWYYSGISFSCDEICGKKTSDATLF